MPIVHVDLVEGRSPERVETMIRAVSQAMATSLEVPIANVRVVVNEMAPHQFGVGGRPWAEVAAERRRQAHEVHEAREVDESHEAQPAQGGQ